jgi:hypothetical protein
VVVIRHKNGPAHGMSLECGFDVVSWVRAGCSAVRTHMDFGSGFDQFA